MNVQVLIWEEVCMWVPSQIPAALTAPTMLLRSVE
jgi:hypothetical protein